MFELIVAAIVAHTVLKKVDFASVTTISEDGGLIKKETKIGRTTITKTPTGTSITRTRKTGF
jgi:hypothetical protein